MTTHYAVADIVTFSLIVIGGLCAVQIRSMQTGPKRGWVKLASFLLISIGIVIYGIGDYQHEQQRKITQATVSGTLVNLHTTTSGPRSSPTQHYNVDPGTGGKLPVLHDQDGLFFMKAENGEHVDVTFTKESGHVSYLRITDGPHTGYEFDEPDVHNSTPSIFFIIVGIINGIIGIAKWIVDHNADPTL